jgi:ribosomal protein S18 acetylase RimI-like enzyme
MPQMAKHGGLVVQVRKRRVYAPRLTAEGTELRRAELRDLPGVLALWDRARSGHANTPDRLGDLERLVANSPAALVVAERDGEVVGALIAAWDGWRGNMYRLAVRGDCRREGLGLSLVRAGEEHLRASGARRITALVAHEDEAANAFWSAVGYPRDAEIGRRVRNL